MSIKDDSLHQGRSRRVTPKPVQPDPGEAAANPRARSARLRAVERLHGS